MFSLEDSIRGQECNFYIKDLYKMNSSLIIKRNEYKEFLEKLYKKLNKFMREKRGDCICSQRN